MCNSIMEICIRDSKCLKMHLFELMQRGTIEKQRFEIPAFERATVMGGTSFLGKSFPYKPNSALLRN